MIANLNNYLPEEITFVVEDSIKEKFLELIFEGATDPKEIIELVNKNFNAIFPENELATRKMDDFEIRETREEYCLKQENEMPKRIEALAEAIETAKRIKQDAQQQLDALSTEIANLAAEVKKGTKDYVLSSKNTIKIALNGHFLYYSWVNNKFQLVKGEKIPSWDKRSLWAQEDKNRAAMKELFGIDFPEVEKPESEEETDEGDENGDF